MQKKPENNRLPKAERVALRADIERLFRSGEAFLAYPIRAVWLRRDDAGTPRVMVSVPKRSHKRAVRRNLLKRRMREAYRLQKTLTESSAALDLALIYVAKEPHDYDTIAAAIRKILEKLSADGR